MGRTTGIAAATGGDGSAQLGNPQARTAVKRRMKNLAKQGRVFKVLKIKDLIFAQFCIAGIKGLPRLGSGRV
ncbi:MAG: hypothetical protein JNK52_01755 [Zoogloeaceae bacterium]|nr:hypothetical protein [Zoogloeaceae bacterium]